MEVLSLAKGFFPNLGSTENPELKLRINKEALCSNGDLDARWFEEELKIKELHLSIDSTELKIAHAALRRRHDDTLDNADVGRSKVEIVVETNALHKKIQQAEEEKEEGLIISNTHSFDEEACGPITLVALLKSCAERRDVHQGSRLHRAALKRGFLKNNVYVGSAIVNAYAKCGELEKAHDVLNKLPVRNLVSWNTLIAGYVQHNHGEKALHCFELMRMEGFAPDKVTFACMLKACGGIGALDKGQEMHAWIVKEGLLEKCTVTGNALVDMYSKFGLLEKAQELFDELPIRDVVTWTTLITGYALQGHGKEALNCFEQMQLQKCSPNAATFLGLLRACSGIQSIYKGQEIHAAIISDGLLEKDTVVGTALVDMYAKCGMLAEAQDVFDELPLHDVLTWSILIDGYVQNTQSKEALNCFERMQIAGFFPGEATIASILKACGSLGVAEKGQELHNQMVRAKSLGKDIVVANALIGMYAKCGLFEKALEVFDGITDRDIISWNALISGYVQHGLGKEALDLLEQMQDEGICPDTVSSACLLKACGSIGDLERGQKLHALAIREGLLDKDIVVANALVDMYIKCGCLEKAEEVFTQLQIRDTISWNSLIAGHAQYVQGEEALKCFEQMQVEGLPADAVTFAAVLNACASIGASDKGQEIHGQISREGMMEKNLLVSNSLIDMYAKCGLLEKAQEVFDKLSVRDVVSWNALIAGYAQHGYGEKALVCFEQMQIAGLSADSITFVCTLKACGSIGAAEKGQELHAQILKGGLIEKNVLIGTALVDMYAICGMLEKAQEVFDKLPYPDVFSWNALVTGYAQYSFGEEVLHCFEQMLFDGITPDIITFVSVLKACGSMGAVCKGQEMHAEIVKRGWLQTDGIISNALVDMYAICGMLLDAHQIFDELSVLNISAWNALITGYSLLGEDKQMFDLVRELERRGDNLDFFTFSIVITTCSHGGLVDKGQVYYELMTLSLGIMPTGKHNTCIVDLFARAGQLDMAAAVIQKLPTHVDITVWHTLLGACRMLRNKKLGTWAFEHASELDLLDASSYVSLSNI